ncbi:right-handed parallel beta-helix repeat-containing protein [Halorussus caseinilyticus]|uniref:right-handed parallel beta-helix repeat-containing protein n=1 Tax=Halorussus caseinilyticus TaxID=3034025 RepID=UPI0023E8685D|nr:right-handed parallel beta-helix repeat-containing protein [Halorussus sp. DT72]
MADPSPDAAELPLAVGLAFALAVVAAVGPASAGPTAALDRGSATPIGDCTTVTEPGEYVLTGNVTDGGTETCIEIRADDVTVDGAGHAVDGESVGQATAGVSVAPGSANVTVRNLTVSRWAFGVRYEGVAGGEIADVTARFDADGIHVADSSGVVVRSATAENNVVGVSVSDSSSVEIRDTDARWNAIYGVSVAAATNVSLSNVAAAQNEEGIGLFRTEGVEIRDATAVSNRMIGVELVSAAATRVSNLTVRDNAAEAFVRTSRGFEAVAASDLALTRTRDSRVSNLTTGPDWSVSLGPETADADISLADGTERFSFSGSGVVVSSADAPPPPANRSALSEAVRAEATAANATLSLAVEYDDADLAAADLAESTLGLWRYDRVTWTPVADRADPDRNLVCATVTDFSVFAVLGERSASSADTDDRTDSAPVSVTRQAGVEIRFTCENVRVSVPEGTTYSLVVHYYVPETGEYGRTLVGPFEGTVEEPFDAEIVFFEVGVLVGRSVVASGYIPEECPNAPGITLVGDKP